MTYETRPFLLLLALLLLLPPAAHAAEPFEAPPIITLDEIERGQKGYGMSVFEGTEPSRFEVEVVGIMRNSSPATSYILARLSGSAGHVPLEQSGVIGGMSGSPVYLDGRLAGAVAFSWAFSQGALAGITPIEGMRRIHQSPHPDVQIAGGPPVSLPDLVAGNIPETVLADQLRWLEPASSGPGGAPSSILWTASGFGAQSRKLLSDRLPLMAPAGTSGRIDHVDGELQAGSAVSAVLIDGDFQLAANGTVTDRDGDKILAFGHPFLGLGPVEVPMAPAEVVTVVSSDYSSFKIANIGPMIGAFQQDRLLGIQGRIGAQVQMVPVTLKVTDAAGQTEQYSMRIARMPMLTPGLLGAASLSGLEVASYSAGNQGLDLTLAFRIAGHDDLYLTQSFDGPSAVSQALGYVVSMAAYLVQNELEHVEIDEVELEISQSDRPRTISLTGAHAERSVVRPGQTVELHLDLVPYRGEPTRRKLEVKLPEETPDGTYYLFVGDGASIDAARMAVEPTQPVVFPQALRYLRSLHSRRELGVLGVFAGKGLSVAGEVMPRLPGSVASIWGASSGDATPLSLAVAQEYYEPLERPLEGLVRVDLTVRRRDPVPGGETGTATGETDMEPAGPAPEGLPTTSEEGS